MASKINENIAINRAHFNKIKTKIKENNKNSSKCTLFITEKEYDDIFIFYLDRRTETIGKYAPQKGYLKISDNKYIMVSFYMISFNPNFPYKNIIICKETNDRIDPSNICFVKNYDNYIDFFRNFNKFNSFENLRNIKNKLNAILSNILKNKSESISSEILRKSLNVLFSGFIQKYEEVLDIEILTYNKVSNIKVNNLNKNNFYNTYSTEIIKLLNDFIETRIWNYVEFQSILTKLSILIYKYDIITNYSISSKLQNNNN